MISDSSHMRNKTPKTCYSDETYLYRPVSPSHDAVRIAWAYPAKYSIAMSSLGYMDLFRKLDENPNAAAKRVTSDTINTLYIPDVELVGFSFSFELDIIEIISMLDRLKMPLYSSERSEQTPLVFAGGPVVMANPEPYTPFFDFFIIGDGEEVLNRLISTFQKYRHLTSRRELLITLAQNVPGIYVPSLYDVEYSNTGEITGIYPKEQDIPFPVTKQYVTDPDSLMTSTPILTPDAVFSNRFLVEVMRGCAHRCHFCLASYSMMPVRSPVIDKLIEQIRYGLNYTNKIGLLGALISDHPEFTQLCEFLRSVPNISISTASIRADTLTTEIADTLRHGGQKTLTIAVETGSERLRKVINKHLKTETIYNAAGITAKAGIKELKLYMMVGLPHETIEDLEDTVELIKTIKLNNKRLKLSVGCSTFVPKASTPFQWTKREHTKVLEEKQRFLRKSIFKFSNFKPSSPGWDYVQALLSRGDRRLAPFILDFIKEGGNLGAISRISRRIENVSTEVDIPAPDWYALRERKPQEILPWDPIFLGISKETLYKESCLHKPDLTKTGG